MKPETALKGAKELVTALFEMQYEIVAPNCRRARRAQINAVEAQRYAGRLGISFKASARS
jgi:hypothetical protein